MAGASRVAGVNSRHCGGMEYDNDDGFPGNDSDCE